MSWHYQIRHMRDEDGGLTLAETAIQRRRG